MALAPERLRILAFPQHIDREELELNVLILPTQGLLNLTRPFESQLTPGTTVDLPKFIAAELSLEVKTIKGLGTYPFSDAPTDSSPLTVSFPTNLPALYEGLAAQFTLDTTSPKTTSGAPPTLADSDGIQKYLPHSYRNAFNFTTPRTQFAKTDDSYHCAIKHSPPFDPAFPKAEHDVTWGRVLAFCLRQPLLAEKIGLLHHVTVTLLTPDYFAEGGWVYFNLTSTLADFDITDAKTELRQYAARIPEITQPRQLFAALLFPVGPGPDQPNGDFDTLKIEAADYDDGFAKIVHVTQPVSANLLSEEPDGIHVQRDIGIRLGWDDEQVLIWHNRQILADPTIPGPVGKRIDAPLGVFSYRVDVKETHKLDWNSLVAIQSTKELTLAGEFIAEAGKRMETGVQVYPIKINAAATTRYWLPSYFTQWYGQSLVLPDARAPQLDASGALLKPETYSDVNIPEKPAQTRGLYEPILPTDCELKYGKEYDFRVRLSDLTGGGPLLTDPELNDAPATSATITFKRYVAPKHLTLNPVTPQPDETARTTVFYTGESFEVFRPRLGYPALLFTEMDTADAFQKLIEDRDFLHKNKAPNQTIKEQREVGYFDPDVDQILVIVEVKSLSMDNLDSLNQREAFVLLYQTLRKLPKNREKPFLLELEYRDANVIAFGNEIDLGDLNISKAQIANGKSIVVPTSRDIRITLLPVCSDKDALPGYFGFEKSLFAKELVRTGEPIQFFVRQDATAESVFFRKELESRQLQAIYLQPDPTQVNDPSTLTSEVVAGKEGEQATLMQRLADQLELDFKGLTLIGKPGERIQFGCSNRIRHTLAPDGSSLTFATKGDLINHWLCVLSFEINRDWTWDGLTDVGIEIGREKQFTGEADTLEKEIVGYVALHKTASRLATTNPDRSHTRVVFVDAVEPKKDVSRASSKAHPFPNTIDAGYTLTPHFIASVKAASAKKQIAECDVQVPVTTIPSQVPKVAAAGIALSPYLPNERYAETTVRQRYLWFEFEEPIQDPNDNYFARVLAYAPDPLLSFPSPDQVLVKQEDLPLAINPEFIRVITTGHGNDRAGFDAMQPMTAETDNPELPLIKMSPVHYLLPLPPGLHHESDELFGFFTYELRVGHTERIWSTACGRFGHPTRVNGVQHPAPPLKCLINRRTTGIAVTAQYALAVFNGKNVTSKPPRTEIWCMLYAQVRQADARKNRNILLAESKLRYLNPQNRLKTRVDRFLAERHQLPLKTANSIRVNLDVPSVGAGQWTEDEIIQLLDQFDLAHDTGLSVLAVEMMPRYDQYIYHGPPVDDTICPLSADLGQYRILRTSRLVAAPEICSPEPL